MAHELEYEPSVLRQLQGLPAAIQRRILERIESLAGDPRPPGCEKLEGMDAAWRIRSGDFRIVYRVDDKARVVTITRVGHRSQVYRRK